MSLSRVSRGMFGYVHFHLSITIIHSTSLISSMMTHMISELNHKGIHYPLVRYGHHKWFAKSKNVDTQSTPSLELSTMQRRWHGWHGDFETALGGCYEFGSQWLGTGWSLPFGWHRCHMPACVAGTWSRPCLQGPFADADFASKVGSSKGHGPERAPCQGVACQVSGSPDWQIETRGEDSTERSWQQIVEIPHGTQWMPFQPWSCLRLHQLVASTQTVMANAKCFQNQMVARKNTLWQVHHVPIGQVWEHRLRWPGRQCCHLLWSCRWWSAVVLVSSSTSALETLGRRSFKSTSQVTGLQFVWFLPEQVLHDFRMTDPSDPIDPMTQYLTASRATDRTMSIKYYLIEATC